MLVNHPRSLAKLALFQRQPQRHWLIVATLVFAYAIVLHHTLQTMGEPRATAVAEKAKIAAKRALDTAPVMDLAGTEFEDDDDVAVFVDPSRVPTAPDIATKPKPAASKATDDPDATGESEWVGDGERGDAASHNNTSPLMKELEVPLPSPYLPSALSSIMLFCLCSIHALFYLMCHWFPWFKSMAFLTPCRAGEVRAGDCFALITPHAHRGQPALVPLERSDRTGRLCFVFQRQRYEYIPKGGDGEAEIDRSSVTSVEIAHHGTVRLITCPVTAPLDFYTSSRGLTSRHDIDSLMEHFGLNSLTVARPSFVTMFTTQLLSPLTVFQVFCALLWLLDEYWQFTLFSFGTLFLFEGVTVFQRQRTMATLSQMTSKSGRVYVYRLGIWTDLSTEHLLPGDIMSLCAKRPKATSTTSVSTVTPAPATVDDTTQEAVPCDCVILRGSAVVNEATLTGESVPQMKDAVGIDDGEKDDNRKLEMDGRDRVHVLFSGTSLISTTSAAVLAQNREDSDFPKSPDGGCAVYVLRTGFSSSQGSLLQMIEFSTQQVSSDTYETGIALLVLLVFALISAAYVMKKGLEKGDRTTHELLLKCVIIITSVVPRQLPMQMAMAVNTALMSLMKAGVFCTEPYRVPFAGKISICLFDKTGTLTTDQLKPVGIVNNTASKDEYLGATVIINAVQSRLELNGGRGTVASCSDDVERYNVIVKKEKLALHKSKLTIGRMEDGREPIPMMESSVVTAMVLASCHSLVSVESEGSGDGGKELIGDPIELAALNGVNWDYSADEETATPIALSSFQRLMTSLRRREADMDNEAIKIIQAECARNQVREPPRDELLKLGRDKESSAIVLRRQELTTRIQELEKIVTDIPKRRQNHPVSKVKILHRYHFSSQLQRMSVMAEVQVRGEVEDAILHAPLADVNRQYKSTDSIQTRRIYLVKGSPEAILSLLTPNQNIPTWYYNTYRCLSERGMRVLALAYKWSMDIDTIKSNKKSKDLLSRAAVECDLRFAGFVAFACQTRGDTGVVIKSLLESDHLTCMVTGDAPLTALHVAKEVSICRREHALLLSICKDDPHRVEWVDAVGEAPKRQPFDVSNIPTLAQSFDLITSEAALECAARGCIVQGITTTIPVLDEAEHADSERLGVSPLWALVSHFCVFARMSPSGKAKVIRAMQQRSGHHVLMCGDGGNDVGALKQADVGVALLGGFGNVNTTTVTETVDTTASDIPAEKRLNLRQEELLKLQMEAQRKINEHMTEKKAAIMGKQALYQQEEIDKLRREGQVGVMSTFSAVKNVAMRVQKEIQEEQMKATMMYGNVFDDKTKNGLSGGLDPVAELDSGLPVVRPGDASVAAPFTSRSPSIKSVVDLIRQGRCTLLSALQQQQIMMLECVIAAYTLAALSLEGARSSERQMMASSWLILIASLAFSYATPIDRMHPVKPLRSLFHPAVWISIAGQALIHLYCMVTAVHMATEAMGPIKLREVVNFHKRQKMIRAGTLEPDVVESDDPMADFWMLWQTPFLPNLLNTVVFLVETSQMVAVLFVNYKGRPWMKGVLENQALFLSLFSCVAGVACCAWEWFPWLNALIHLESFPSDEFRWQVLFLVSCSLIGTFVWDRVVTAIFAPVVFKAMMSEALATRPNDLLPLVVTILKIGGGLFLLSTGNFLLWIGLYFLYRRFNQPVTDKKNNTK